MRRALALALIALLGACGGDNGPEDPAVAALRRQFDFLSKGQHGRIWDELHPAQQALLPRDAYAACADAATAGGFTIVELDVDEVYDEQIVIPGTSTSATAKAITIRMTLRSGTESGELTDTFHEIDVDGAWRWSMTSDRIDECLRSAGA